jgi:hypothetical protein
VGKLYAVCVWKTTERGILSIPSNPPWPIGCSSFRGLALRDCDLADMEELHPGQPVQKYDWRFSRKGRDVVASCHGATAYPLVAGYMNNIAMAHADNQWHKDVLPFHVPSTMDDDVINRMTEGMDELYEKGIM